MKKSVFFAALLVTLPVTAAVAADLSAKRQAVVSPVSVPMWTGVYAGLNAGGTWGNSASLSTTGFPIYARPGSSSTTVPVVAGMAAGLTGSQSLNNAAGFIGGAQFGYNLQVGSALIGLETDFQGVAGAEQTGEPSVRAFPYSYYSLSRGTNLEANEITGSTGEKSLNYFGTLRAKIGYLATSNVLIYGTGGFAYGGTTLKSTTQLYELSNLTDEFGPGNWSKSSLLAGWSAGGGAEWMFAQNWSAKVEYLYYDLGNTQMFGGAGFIVRNNVPPYGGTPQGEIAAIAGQNVTTRFNGSIARLGVNYHFNPIAAPVIAKF